MTETEEKQAKEEHEELVAQHTIDLSKLTPQKHIWVDRGAVMSCEGALHPNHRSFKMKK
jgi:hypothetical protein